MRAFAAAQKFIEKQMDASELMAIMTFQGGAVRVKTDFTDDRARLDEVMLRLIYGDDLDGDGIPDNPETAPRSARTMRSSTSSTPIASCRRCRPR